MEYVSKLPNDASFVQNGLTGYNYVMNNKEISFSFEDVHKGHDKYGSNDISTYYYIVLEGSGIFRINGVDYKVEKNDIVEIPPKTKFVFSGCMKLIMISNPTYNPDNDNVYEDNDIVVE